MIPEARLTGHSRDITLSRLTGHRDKAPYRTPNVP